MEPVGALPVARVCFMCFIDEPVIDPDDIAPDDCGPDMDPEDIEPLDIEPLDIEPLVMDPDCWLPFDMPPVLDDCAKAGLAMQAPAIRANTADLT